MVPKKAVKVELSVLMPAEEDSKEYTINANHYARVQEALTILEEAPGMQDIREEGPLTLDDLAAVSPYDRKKMKASLAKKEPFFCGGVNLLHQPASRFVAWRPSRPQAG